MAVVGTITMKCLSCEEQYRPLDGGTCKECYEEASETEEELKQEIEDLRSKVAFLRFSAPPDQPYQRSAGRCFPDVVLVAASDDSGRPEAHPVSVPSHKAVLASRSPVFRAMLETEMEESLSGTIKICDASYEALLAFVNYMYTAEARLDEQIACELLVLADKYQVKHLKAHCEGFLLSNLNVENSLPNFVFARQHNATGLEEAALSLVLENLDKLSKQEGYKDLMEKDAKLLVEIYEAYLSRQVNTAATAKDSTSVKKERKQ